MRQNPEAANIELGADDPIDGRSFLPQLMGKKGKPRDWQLCHYQPYHGKFIGRQYVCNANYKLYRDSSFFNVPNDLKEKNNLSEGKSSKKGEKNRRKLSKVLKTVPPAPPIQGGPDAKERPVYPDWKNIVNPND